MTKSESFSILSTDLLKLKTFYFVERNIYPSFEEDKNLSAPFHAYSTMILVLVKIFLNLKSYRSMHIFLKCLGTVLCFAKYVQALHPFVFLHLKDN